ncbi:MAG: NUDIX domain-containing protein [Gammaproteobacteria bacterium]|nr:NUDIX domain-containing protein [Gammaproteobacteria bacterium]
MRWKANVTVAAVIEKEGKFLMIEEQASDGISVINQPAGHLEENESLLNAVKREVLEETAWSFEADYVIGIYLYPSPDNGITYLRVCYSGRAIHHFPERQLDDGIIQAMWLSPGEIEKRKKELRSPLVGQCLYDYLADKRYPLELIHHFEE